MRRTLVFSILTLCLALPLASPRCNAQGEPIIHFKPQQADAALLTAYSKLAPGATQDSLFIIALPANAASTAVTLSANVTNGNNAKLEIQEIVFSPTDYSYSWRTIAQNPSAKEISTTVSNPTAYRVLRTEGTDTTKKRIWILFDNVHLTDIYIDDRCDARTLTPRFNYDRSTIIEELFAYPDLTSSYLLPINSIGRIYFKNFQWLDDRLTPLTDFSTSTLKIDAPPPLEPHGYRLIVTNFYGRVLSASSPLLDPISVMAEMNVQYIDKPDSPAAPWQPAGKTLTHEAPLFLKLGDNAKNADSLFWTIRNDPRAVRSGEKDTLFFIKALASERITPEIDKNLFSAGTYIATLRAKNNRIGCSDTANLTIHVDSSLINTREIPNVFTPNGDFINDVFRLKNPETSVRSIRNFKIEIFNRNGQQVYSYSGPPRAWEGWNGKQKNNGPDEPQGVYFFIIQAEGWDGKSFRGETYRGFIHLYR